MKLQPWFLMSTSYIDLVMGSDDETKSCRIVSLGYISVLRLAASMGWLKMRRTRGNSFCHLAKQCNSRNNHDDLLYFVMTTSLVTGKSKTAGVANRMCRSSADYFGPNFVKSEGKHCLNVHSDVSGNEFGMAKFRIGTIPCHNSARH